jgi:hypothetical protein
MTTDARIVIANQPCAENMRIGESVADAIIAALRAAGLEIRAAVDPAKHFVWCHAVNTECNCSGYREAAEARAERLRERIKLALPYIGPGYEYATLRDILEKALEGEKQ